MATIRAWCDDCGERELTSADITVRVCSADSQGSYSFACTGCNRVTVKDAQPRIIELLVTSGVRLVTWHLPKELDERVGMDASALTHDDLIDFHEALEEGSVFERLGDVSHLDIDAPEETDSAHVEMRGFLDLMRAHLVFMRDSGLRTGTTDVLERELHRRLKEIEGEGTGKSFKNV